MARDDRPRSCAARAVRSRSTGRRSRRWLAGAAAGPDIATRVRVRLTDPSRRRTGGRWLRVGGGRCGARWSWRSSPCSRWRWSPGPPVWACPGSASCSAAARRRPTAFDGVADRVAGRLRLAVSRHPDAARSRACPRRARRTRRRRSAGRHPRAPAGGRRDSGLRMPSGSTRRGTTRSPTSGQSSDRLPDTSEPGHRPAPDAVRRARRPRASSRR